MLHFLKKLFKPKKISASDAWVILQSKAGNEVSIEDKLAFWLYATPIHLVLQRDSFSLASPVPLPLEIEEIEALSSTLNQHFMPDKIHFIWHEKQWFLKLEYNPNITTYAPELAINKDISAYLPTGDGAIQWARISNEIQMLLFEHPVNLAREAKRLPVINSIWCYER